MLTNLHYIAAANGIDLTLFGQRLQQLLADTCAIKYDMSGLRAQFSALEARFSGMEARLNAVEVRLEHLDTLVDRFSDRMEAVQRGQALHQDDAADAAQQIIERAHRSFFAAASMPAKYRRRLSSEARAPSIFASV